MYARLCEKFATLYEEYRYVYDDLSPHKKSRFDQISSGKPKDGITENALFYLSKYLNDHHRHKCIVLIDEYDHPLDVAYRHQYYEQACGFFTFLFGELLKVSIFGGASFVGSIQLMTLKNVWNCRVMTKILRKPSLLVHSVLPNQVFYQALTMQKCFQCTKKFI